MTSASSSSMPPAAFPPGTFTPRPGPGSPGRMLAAQAGTEMRLALRNGEQVLLTLLIPVVLLVGLTLLRVVPLPEPRVDAVVPSVLALAVMSTAFTGQAIALALGWRPAPAGIGWAVLLVLLGCAAFGSLGILLGGSLRAEITLAVANLVWFVLLLAGGIVIPVDQLPGPLAAVAAALPSGALAEGLRAVLATGQPPAGGQVLVLLVWTVAAGALAARTVRLR